VTRRPALILACLVLFCSEFTPLQAQESYDEKLAQRYLRLLLDDPTIDVAFRKLHELTHPFGKTEAWIARLAKGPAHGAGRILRARFLQQVYRFPAALIAYQRALTGNTRHRDFVLLQVGICHRELSDFDAAREAFEKAAAASQRNQRKRQAFELLGKLYLDYGKPALAVRSWRRITALSPDDYYAHRDLALLLGGAGFQQEAIARYRIMLAKFQGAARRLNSHLALGKLLRQLGRFPEAAAAYDKLLDETGPDHWVRRQLYALLRGLYQQWGRLENLVSRYRKLRDRSPWVAAYHQELATTLQLAGKPTQAIAALRKAIARFPKQPRFLLALIAQLRRADRLDALEQAYRALLRLKPGVLAHYITLGQLHWKRGRRADAITVWQAGRLATANKAPEQLLMARHYGRLFTQTRDRGEDPRQLQALALSAHRDAARLSKTALAQRQLARFLHALGRKPEAQRAWAAMVAGPRDTPANWADLAREFLAHGFLARAEHAAREAVRRDATQFELHLLLGRIQSARGLLQLGVASFRLAGRTAVTDHNKAHVRRELVALYRAKQSLPKLQRALEAELAPGQQSAEIRAEALLTLVELHVSAGRAARAIVYLQQAIDEAPPRDGRRIQRLTQLAELHHRRNPPVTEAAIEVYRQLSKINHPLRWQYYLRSSELLEQAGQRLAARQWLDLIHRGRPRNAEVLHKAGVALGRHADRREQAIELLQRAIARKPGGVEYYWSLASLLHKHARLEQERRIYRRILSIATDESDIAAARKRLHTLLHQLAEKARRKRDPAQRLRLLLAARGHGATPEQTATTLARLAQVTLALMSADGPTGSPTEQARWRALALESLGLLRRRYPLTLVPSGKIGWIRAWLLAHDLQQRHRQLLGTTPATEPRTRSYRQLISAPQLASPRRPNTLEPPLLQSRSIRLRGRHNFRPLPLPDDRLLVSDGARNYQILDLTRGGPVAADDPLQRTLRSFRAPQHGTDHQLAARLEHGLVLLGTDLRAIGLDGRPLWRLAGRPRWQRRRATGTHPSRRPKKLDDAGSSPWSVARLRRDLFYRAARLGPRLYALDGQGRLFAIEARSGKLIWVRRLDVSGRAILPHFRRSGGPDLAVGPSVVTVRWRGIHTVSARDGRLLWKLTPDEGAPKGQRDPAPFQQMVRVGARLYLLDTDGRLSVRDARTGRYEGPGQTFTRAGFSRSQHAYLAVTADLIALVNSNQRLLLLDTKTLRLLADRSLPIKLYAGYDRTPQRITLVGSGQRHTLFVLADKLLVARLTRPERPTQQPIRIQLSQMPLQDLGHRSALLVRGSRGLLLHGPQLRIYTSYQARRNRLLAQQRKAPADPKIPDQLARLARARGDETAEQSAYREVLACFPQPPPNHALYRRAGRALLAILTRKGQPLARLRQGLALARTSAEKAETLARIARRLERDGQPLLAAQTYRALLQYRDTTVDLERGRRLTAATWAAEQLARSTGETTRRARAVATLARARKSPSARNWLDTLDCQPGRTELILEALPVLPAAVAADRLRRAWSHDPTPSLSHTLALILEPLLRHRALRPRRQLPPDPVISWQLELPDIGQTGWPRRLLRRNGRLLLMAGRPARIRSIDPRSGRLTRDFPAVARVVQVDVRLGVNAQVLVADARHLAYAGVGIACHELKTGAVRWIFTDGDLRFHPPALIRGRLLALDIEGRLHCLEAETGLLLWRNSAARDAGKSRRDWESNPRQLGEPLIAGFGDLVYCLFDQLVAFDLRTGRRRWRVTQKSTWLKHYVSPQRVGDRLYLLNQSRLRTIELTSGRVLRDKRIPMPASQFLVRGTTAYLVAGYSKLLLWDLELGVALAIGELNQRTPMLVLGREQLYSISRNDLRCFDLSGKPRWRARLPWPAAAPRTTEFHYAWLVPIPLARSGWLWVARPGGILAAYRSLAAEQTDLRALAKRHPGAALLARAGLALQFGRTGEAAALHEQAIPLLRDRSLVRETRRKLYLHYLALGRQHAGRQAWQPATRAMTRAARHATTEDERLRATFHRARLHCELGAFERAAALYQQVLSRRPMLFCQLDAGRAVRAWADLRFRLARLPALATAWRRRVRPDKTTDPRRCPGTPAARQAWLRQALDWRRKGAAARAAWCAMRALTEPTGRPPTPALTRQVQQLIARTPAVDPRLTKLHAPATFAPRTQGGLAHHRGLIISRDRDGRPRAHRRSDLSLAWEVNDMSPELVSVSAGRRGRGQFAPRVLLEALLCAGRGLTSRDPRTGQLHWVYDPTVRHDPFDTFSKSRLLQGRPTQFWGPARIGSFLYTVDRSERLHCVDPLDGRPVWIVSVEQVARRGAPGAHLDPGARHWNVAAVGDRTLLLQIDALYLFAADGRFRFRTPTQNSRLAFSGKSESFAPYLDLTWDARRIYLLTHAGKLQTLSLDRPKIRPTQLHGRAIAANARGLFLLSADRLSAYTPDLSRVRWSQQIKRAQPPAQPLRQYGPALLLGERTVYLNREALHAFDQSSGKSLGALNWPVSSSRTGFNWAYPILAGRDLIVRIESRKPVLYRGRP